MRCFGLLIALMMSCAAHAQDIVIIGETHDNPGHHAEQARRVAQIAPSALIFEMLTPAQALPVAETRPQDEAALEAALGWHQGGWPDFAMYYPIFAAAPDARVYGAGLTREEAGAAMQGGFDGPMEGEAAAYGLENPLPEDQQAAREELQMEAHCNALPEEMLPGSVRIQRLRDAMLARAARIAVAETGGPVVVITGNGHARRDWGVPAILAEVAPELEVYVIGQTESEAELSGVYDEVLSSPPPEREDPCAVFSKS